MTRHPTTDDRIRAAIDAAAESAQQTNRVIRGSLYRLPPSLATEQVLELSEQLVNCLEVMRVESRKDEVA